MRDDLTGIYTRYMGDLAAIEGKINAGRNDFFSSGQMPLDEVAEGRLDRFGFIDPDNGGRVRSGVIGTYYRKEWDNGNILKLDGFVSRSLFDLFSNFTFFLNDPIRGDEIQQRDSRLQGGINAQYLHPHSHDARLSFRSDGRADLSLFWKTGRDQPCGSLRCTVARFRATTSSL